MIINSRKQYIPAFSTLLQLLSSSISHESKFLSVPVHLGLLSKDGLPGILITNEKPPVGIKKVSPLKGCVALFFTYHTI